jgi:uncharacterized membrane protein
MSANQKPGEVGFSKERFEAFSDAVIAIAMTLLVLDLHSPVAVHGSLLRGLWNEWPAFAAFAVSFFSIGIFWINHHQFFHHVREVDYFLLVANLVLLMWICLWPFTTKVLAENLQHPLHEHGAALLYVSGFLALGFTWAATFAHVRRKDLLDRRPSPKHEAYLRRRSLAGMVGYSIALAVAIFSAGVALAICAIVTLYYFTPAHDELPEDLTAD